MISVMMKHRRFSMSALSAAFIGVLATAATAGDDGSLKARLEGFQEVPAVSTTGNGRFRGMISKDETSIDYELSYADLEGATVLFAHIHLGQRTANGGVMAFLCGGGGKPACPASPGSVSGTIIAADIIGPAGQGVDSGELAAVVDALRSKVAYVNVQTSLFPSGEIRGQVKD